LDGIVDAGSMTTAATEYWGLGRAGLARRVIVFFTALGFVFQAYIAQTHVHDASGGLRGVGNIASPHSATPEKTPLDHGATGCPFCQAVIHAGAFLTPAAVTPHLPCAWLQTLAAVFAAPAASAVAAYGWQSRAPPPL
jgi:hypothetical protein